MLGQEHHSGRDQASAEVVVAESTCGAAAGSKAPREIWEHSAPHSYAFLISIPSASVWGLPRTLCQRRHLPEPISGTRELPVSVSWDWETRNGEGELGRRRDWEGRRKGGGKGTKGKQMKAKEGRWERRQRGPSDFSFPLSSPAQVCPWLPG